MSLTAVLAVVAAGLVAGAMNVIVGSGSLVTFPTLLAVGFAPVVANVTNTVGLVPGSLSGVTAYRREATGSAGSGSSPRLRFGARRSLWSRPVARATGNRLPARPCPCSS